MTQKDTRNKRPSRFRVAFMFILLTILLVVTPYASWYYLTKGLDYRKAQLALLDDFGTMPSGNWLAMNGDSIDTELWSGQITLIVISSNLEQQQINLEGIQRLHTQFHDRSDVRFYHFVPEEIQSDNSAFDSDSMLTTAILPKEEFLRFADQWSGLIKKGIENQLILIDRSLQVRQAFSLNSEKSLKEVVQVIAVLLPPKKVERPSLIRESEK